MLQVFTIIVEKHSKNQYLFLNKGLEPETIEHFLSRD